MSSLESVGCLIRVVEASSACAFCHHECLERCEAAWGLAEAPVNVLARASGADVCIKIRAAASVGSLGGWVSDIRLETPEEGAEVIAAPKSGDLVVVRCNIPIAGCNGAKLIQTPDGLVGVVLEDLADEVNDCDVLLIAKGQVYKVGRWRLDPWYMIP